MPSDPYTVLRALLRAEAARSTPKPNSDQPAEAKHDPMSDDHHPSKPSQPPQPSKHD
jgi:hypothetical protein